MMAWEEEKEVKIDFLLIDDIIEEDTKKTCDDIFIFITLWK